jgi:hypothetical protein
MRAETKIGPGEGALYGFGFAVKRLEPAPGIALLIEFGGKFPRALDPAVPKTLT